MVGQAQRAWRYRYSAAVRPFQDQMTQGHRHHPAIPPLPGGLVWRNGCHPAIPPLHSPVAVRDLHGDAVLSDDVHIRCNLLDLSNNLFAGTQVAEYARESASHSTAVTFCR
jgi:hypothetical protein